MYNKCGQTRRTEFYSRQGRWNYSLHHHSETDSLVTRLPIKWIKRTERESNHSLPWKLITHVTLRLCVYYIHICSSPSSASCFSFYYTCFHFYSTLPPSSSPAYNFYSPSSSGLLFLLLLLLHLRFLLLRLCLLCLCSTSLLLSFLSVNFLFFFLIVFFLNSVSRFKLKVLHSPELLMVTFPVTVSPTRNTVDPTRY
jgi:hypothetical protein